MNEEAIRNGLRKHWHWIKNTDYDNVADLVIALGNKDPNDYPIDSVLDTINSETNYELERYNRTQ